MSRSRRTLHPTFLLATTLLALLLLPVAASAQVDRAEPNLERPAPLPWEPPAPDRTPRPDDGVGVVTAAASSTACDNNSDGDQTWNGCRGTGCNVCVEKVAAYPCYYVNHPNCSANSICYGLYYDCDSSCPAPVAADACSNTSYQVDTCGSCSYPAYGTDGDYDGVPDRLEYDLAHKFFPAIRMRDHPDDKGASYFDRGWSIPYTVQPLPPTGVCNEGYECLEIRYGIAYWKDTGDTWFGFSSHLGDSEFYAVLLQRTTSWSLASGTSSYWQMIRDFTAAHWGASGDSSKMASYGHCGDYCPSWDNNQSACQSSSYCGWQPGICYGTASSGWYSCSSYWQEGDCYFAGCSWIDSECYATTSTPPCWSTYPKTSYVTLYAAEGKHALYHSDYECDNGGLFDADDCPSHEYNLRWDKAGKLQNVGSFAEHANFDTYLQHPNGSKLYYVWGGDSFADSTDYRDHFLAPLDWRLP